MPVLLGKDIKNLIVAYHIDYTIELNYCLFSVEHFEEANYEKILRLGQMFGQIQVSSTPVLLNLFLFDSMAKLQFTGTDI